MEHDAPSNDIVGPDYCGQILTGGFSNPLKARVWQLIESFRAFDESGSPAIPYIAAWRESEKRILWYEFAGTRFAQLMECRPRELAERFNSRVVDRHVYRYPDPDTITKEVLNRSDMNVARQSLRRQSQVSEISEAVYKVALPSDRVIWLKDQARTETHAADDICISLGCLTEVSKEMELEEQCVQLIAKLKTALTKVKTLSGLLPICTACKKIRDDQGYWSGIDDYLRQHSEAEFRHSICPTCARKQYPELYDPEEENASMDKIRDEIVDLDVFFGNL